MSNHKIVLITDDNKEFCDRLSAALSAKGFVLAVCPKDGLTALQMIRDRKPAVAILDAFMCNIDAEGVITKALGESSTVNPVFIVSSVVDYPSLQQRLLGCGAAYYFRYPFDAETLAERIEFFAGFNPAQTVERPAARAGQSLEAAVTEMLLEIGVPAHIMGYRYVRDAIMLTVRNPEVINGVTKVLYPEVAKHNGSTASRVERAIRHAIEVAWDRGDVDVLNSYFGYTVHNLRGKPTNSEFIAMLADKLRLRDRVYS